MNDNKPFFKMLDEICEERGITQEKISFGWIRKLTKNNESHMIIRYEFDLNSAVSYEIAKDKYATYAVLKNKNIPIVEHQAIFNPVSRSEYFDENFRVILELGLKQYGKLVIKANDSCKGKEVFLIDNILDAAAVVEKLFRENNHPLVVVSPFVDIKYEYRAVYLDGEIVYLYKKEKPYVIGDGAQTLNELISLKQDSVEVLMDIDKNLNLEYIPKEGEKITYSWKHNLSGGAGVVKVDSTDPNYEKIINLAKDAGKAIGIRFASVDVILDNNDEISIMEINGSVCMNKFSEIVEDGYNIAKNIYAKAVDKMFNIDDM